MSRCIVIEADGTIAAVASGDPRMFAVQAQPEGRSVFAILNDDGGHIHDGIWHVDEDGNLAKKPGAVGDEPPAYELFLIPA